MSYSNQKAISLLTYNNPQTKLHIIGEVYNESKAEL